MTEIIGQFKVKELILLCVCVLFKNFITKCRKRNVRQTKGTINCIPGQGERKIICVTAFCVNQFRLHFLNGNANLILLLLLLKFETRTESLFYCEQK